MRKIKNIFSLYRLDWRRIFSNPISIFLVVALMILPSLYAWFNIKALWDPYGNTKELPIAFYSADSGTTLGDKQLNIGEEVEKKLEENDQLGWKFVTSKEAVTKGVKSGKYYAGIYLPSEFSEDLLSFINGEIQKPTIEYYFNAKINAIAPKITDKGATALQEQITKDFIETASSTLFDVFQEVGYTVEDNLVSINKIKHLILSTNNHLDQIDTYANEILALKAQLPELKTKLEKANELTDYLPEVDHLAEKLIALNTKFPEVKQQASVILTLQEKIPEIQKAGEQVAMVDEDFAQIVATMTQGIDEAQAALTIIQQVQDLLPNVRQLGNDASNFTEKTQEAAKELQTALPTIQKIIHFNLEALGGVSARVNSIATDLRLYLSNPDTSLTEEEKAAITAILTKASTTLTQQIQLVDGLINWLNQVNMNQSFDGVIASLNQTKDALSGLKKANDALLAVINQISKEELLAYITRVEQMSATVNDLVTNLLNQDITGQIDQVITNDLLPALDNVKTLLDKSSQIDFESLLTATSGTITSAITLLEKYQAEMPAIGQEIHDANTLLNGHMTEIVNGINRGAELYQNELPVLETKLQTAATFAQNDWPKVREEITTTLATVNDKVPTVESAINMAATLVQEDWPTLKQGIEKAAEAIKKGEEVVDLSDIIKLLKSDVAAESDFITNPVELKTHEMYPMDNNGSASTPFYTALCLWVGGLLLSSVAATEFYLSQEDKAKYTKRETFVARMLTFLTIAIPQALIVTFGNYFALGVDVQNPVLSVVFALLVALSFMMIIYVLAGLFGNIGKGIAIILLVLSISGGGGNYPIQVSGKFFQMIHPLLPFTYAVNLLRESAGGVYWPNAIGYIAVLVALFFAFALIGIWAYPHVEGLNKKISALTKESHFFH
ncbi:YhgE/Pip domain-containing protein [Enterococcus lemanii]|uniref:YhgE/Pip family protein n=1 Tax=Enterococcus lemanii TaxID=1159752 RepID=A0ABV9MVF0_9ENTE|nr:YhgE/Pip domain-containing protein [Enterococcus lemanii]MBM7709519.1 putative membrane protein [Enterococcus lemanii]